MRMKGSFVRSDLFRSRQTIRLKKDSSANPNCCSSGWIFACLRPLRENRRAIKNLTTKARRSPRRFAWFEFDGSGRAEPAETALPVEQTTCLHHRRSENLKTTFRNKSWNGTGACGN